MLAKERDSPAAQARLVELARGLEDQSLWTSDPLLAAQLERERASLVGERDALHTLRQRLSQANELADMADAEGDAQLVDEANRDVENVVDEIRALKLETLMRGPADGSSCYLEISAGLGGTEAMDFCAMLLRMYQSWADARGFAFEIKDAHPGPEAGLRSVVAHISSPGTYGWLRGEAGTHRIIRNSPFARQDIRHTSFAQVGVYPWSTELRDEDIDLRESDLRVDTFRSSGPGGQAVNTTSSAVRITHVPTGIAVASQNERSQHRNKATALALLRARLFERKLRDRAVQQQKARSELGEATFGTQIRTYYFNPKPFVKDHRSQHQENDAHAVITGELVEDFMEAYLEWDAGLRRPASR